MPQSPSCLHHRSSTLQKGEMVCTRARCTPRQLAFQHPHKQNHVATTLHLLQTSDPVNVCSASARGRDSQPLPAARRAAQPRARPPRTNSLGPPLSIRRRKVFVIRIFHFVSFYKLLWSVTDAHWCFTGSISFVFYSFACLQHARSALEHERCDHCCSHDRATAGIGI
jgi:hypothetical protein